MVNVEGIGCKINQLEAFNIAIATLVLNLLEISLLLLRSLSSNATGWNNRKRALYNYYENGHGAIINVVMVVYMLAIS